MPLGRNRHVQGPLNEEGADTDIPECFYTNLINRGVCGGVEDEGWGMGECSMAYHRVHTGSFFQDVLL